LGTSGSGPVFSFSLYFRSFEESLRGPRDSRSFEESLWGPRVLDQILRRLPLGTSGFQIRRRVPLGTSGCGPDPSKSPFGDLGIWIAGKRKTRTNTMTTRTTRGCGDAVPACRGIANASVAAPRNQQVTSSTAQPGRRSIAKFAMQCANQRTASVAGRPNQDRTFATELTRCSPSTTAQRARAIRECTECGRFKPPTEYTIYGNRTFHERCRSCEHPICAACGYQHPWRNRLSPHIAR
jgi:hypothetical protein